MAIEYACAHALPDRQLCATKLRAVTARLTVEAFGASDRLVVLDLNVR
jgi:hypothetical protein